MNRLPFTDTHVHFHDLWVLGPTYSWLLPGGEEDPELGDYAAIRSERYWADDFLTETRFQGVERMIHVQAVLGTADPVTETRWLQAFSSRVGVPHDIVAAADLTSPDLEQTLRRHLEVAAVRDILDRRYDGYPTDPAWEAGFALLGKLGLVCCDGPAIKHAEDVCRIAEAHPQTVSCIERAFFDTNWPLDCLFSSDGDVLDACAELIGWFTLAEQEALFSTNADRIFRV